MVTRLAADTQRVEENGPAVAQNGGLVAVRLTLTGVSPLLLNAMSREQLLALRDKTKASRTAAKPSLREEADGKVYRLPDGNPCMPTRNFFACLISAGQFVRLDGKRQVSTADRTMLPGLIQLEDATLPLLTPGTDEPAVWEVDIQQGRNPNGGEAVCIVRPRFDAWEFHCTITVDQQVFSVPLCRQLVEIAGKRIGLCDGRPQRRCTFGRFGITRWEEG
jgi:hypothetical protein